MRIYADSPEPEDPHNRAEAEEAEEDPTSPSVRSRSRSREENEIAADTDGVEEESAESIHSFSLFATSCQDE